MSETTEEIVKEEQGLALYEAKALANVKPFEAELAALKEKHKDIPPLVFGAEGSKDIYRKVKAAEADFRSIKAPIEEARKLDKAAVKRLGEVIDEHYNLVKNEAEKIQLEKKSEREAYEKEDQRIKDEKKEAEEKQILEREREIFAIGGKYDKENDTFSLGTVENIKRETIKTASADLYQNEILRLFKEASDKIEAERQETERLRQEAEEKQQEEARLLKLEQDRLREEQAELLQQRFEIRMDRLRAIGLEGQPTVNVKEISNDDFRAYYDKVAEEIAAAKQAEADKKERERVAEERKAILSARYKQLEDVSVTPVAIIYGDRKLMNTDTLIEMKDDEFSKFAERHNSLVQEAKAEAERVRLEELENQRKAAEKHEKQKSRLLMLHAVGYEGKGYVDFAAFSDDEWDAFYKEQKAVFDKKQHKEWLAEQDRLAKIEEAKRIAKIEEGKDKEKWKDVLDYLKKTPLHDMRSNQYRSKMKTVRDFLSDLN